MNYIYDLETKFLRKTLFKTMFLKLRKSLIRIKKFKTVENSNLP